VVDVVANFREALERVPRVLLSSEDKRILTDATTSADVLENLVSAPQSVVVVGCTGVGKSYLVNELAGTEVSVTGVLRPTTTAIVMAGCVGPAPIDHESEYVVAPGAPKGLVFVDTPPWEFDRVAVEAALGAADLGVLVVSPTRYGDATTEHLWKAMDALPASVIVVNRLRGSDRERTVMIDSVETRFGKPIFASIAEDGSSDDFVRTVLERMVRHERFDDKAAIARSSAANAGRYIASAVTVEAAGLARLDATLDGLELSPVSDGGLAVRESWLATHQEIVADVRRSVENLDAALTGSGEGEIARRIRGFMGRWDASEIERSLDAWRDDVADRFRLEATIRWRRSSTEQLLDQTSWKVGVNPTVQASRRVERAMKSRLESVTNDVHEQLMTLVNSAAMRRKAEWRSMIEDAGSFKPGELLAASNALSEP